jgi:endonuclease-3 related protein
MNPLTVYDTLLKSLGGQDWWPMHGGFNPKEWEVELGAVLTQNTSWKNVEIALGNLKREGIVSRGDVRKIPVKRLENLIRPSGYYRQKAKKLKNLAGFSGEITRENLLGIWGIGKETADSILLYAYDRPFFVVDAYTRRVFSRLGFVGKEWDYERIREFFEKNLPRKTSVYREYHALIVELGKRFCRKRPLCDGCPLKGIYSKRKQLIK